MSITIRVECFECGRELEVTVHPRIPARVYGPPEHCYPAEGGEVEGNICEKCGAAFPEDNARELAAEYAADAREAKYE